jgi:hypothetical protein
MDDYRFLGYELYSMAKQAEKENKISFSNALQTSFNKNMKAFLKSWFPELDLP